MKKEVLESLKKVVEYMHEFELKHYEECEDQEKDNHIYNDVITLQKFIETWGLQYGNTLVYFTFIRGVANVSNTTLGIGFS